MDKQSVILEKINPNSNKLYLIFGGIAAGIGMPPFEFYNSSKIINESKIFIRDLSQTWYQNGIPGMGKDVFEAGDFLRAKINKLEPKELYFVGNSMGGYASILFASMLGFGKVIAFAPQTFISPFKRTMNLDFRWIKQISKTYVTSRYKKHIWDLNPYLNTLKSNVEIHIFVSKNDRLDYLHANALENLESTYIHAFEVGGHRLVRHLRDIGVLSQIFSGEYLNGKKCK